MRNLIKKSSLALLLTGTVAMSGCTLNDLDYATIINDKIGEDSNLSITGDLQFVLHADNIIAYAEEDDLALESEEEVMYKTLLESVSSMIFHYNVLYDNPNNIANVELDITFGDKTYDLGIVQINDEHVVLDSQFLNDFSILSWDIYELITGEPLIDNVGTLFEEHEVYKLANTYMDDFETETGLEDYIDIPSFNIPTDIITKDGDTIRLEVSGNDLITLIETVVDYVRDNPDLVTEFISEIREQLNSDEYGAGEYYATFVEMCLSAYEEMLASYSQEEIRAFYDEMKAMVVESIKSSEINRFLPTELTLKLVEHEDYFDVDSSLVVQDSFKTYVSIHSNYNFRDAGELVLERILPTFGFEYGDEIGTYEVVSRRNSDSFTGDIIYRAADMGGVLIAWDTSDREFYEFEQDNFRCDLQSVRKDGTTSTVVGRTSTYTKYMISDGSFCVELDELLEMLNIPGLIEYGEFQEEQKFAVYINEEVVDITPFIVLPIDGDYRYIDYVKVRDFVEYLGYTVDYTDMGDGVKQIVITL